MNEQRGRRTFSAMFWDWVFGFVESWSDWWLQRIPVSAAAMCVQNGRRYPLAFGCSKLRAGETCELRTTTLIQADYLECLFVWSRIPLQVSLRIEGSLAAAELGTSSGQIAIGRRSMDGPFPARTTFVLRLERPQ